MNNALFTSKTGLWETPQEFFDKLNREEEAETVLRFLP